jgi:hypothetical protein
VKRWFWFMVAAGLVVRVVLAFATRGAAFDIDSFEIVRRGLEHDPLHVYAEVNHGFYRWPYPPAYFPWIALAGWLSDATGLRFDGWFQLPAILADAGIAWLVWQLLALRGKSERVRLLGAGLVMFGPTFLLISGYHGQIDATAILPALAAVYVWERGGVRRGLWAGLLVGVGGAVKIVPLAMLLPLVVAARGRREAGWLVGGASAVMAVVLLPWLAADFGGTIDSLKNRGFPGLGGISLILNPDLTDAALRGTVPDNTALVEWLNRNGWIVPALLLVGVAVLLWNRRPPVMESALIVWLVLTVFGVNFALQYAVWVLPFLIASGRLRSALALQLLLLPPALVFYMAPWQSEGAVVVYYVCMTAVWVLMVGLLATTVRDAVRGKREPAAA